MNYRFFQNNLRVIITNKFIRYVENICIVNIIINKFNQSKSFNFYSFLF